MNCPLSFLTENIVNIDKPGRKRVRDAKRSEQEHKFIPMPYQPMKTEEAVPSTTENVSDTTTSVSQSCNNVNFDKSVNNGSSTNNENNCIVQIERKIWTSNNTGNIEETFINKENMFDFFFTHRILYTDDNIVTLNIKPNVAMLNHFVNKLQEQQQQQQQQQQEMHYAPYCLYYQRCPIHGPFTCPCVVIAHLIHCVCKLFRELHCHDETGKCEITIGQHVPFSHILIDTMEQTWSLILTNISTMHIFTSSSSRPFSECNTVTPHLAEFEHYPFNMSVASPTSIIRAVQLIWPAMSSTLSRIDNCNITNQITQQQTSETGRSNNEENRQSENNGNNISCVQCLRTSVLCSSCNICHYPVCHDCTEVCSVCKQATCKACSLHVNNLVNDLINSDCVLCTNCYNELIHN